MRSQYRSIVIDPPWPYRWTSDGSRKGVAPYPSMGIMEIAELPVDKLAAPEAHVFLWATPEFNRRGEASRIIQWWGFEYVGEITWAKPGLGVGSFPRITHEYLCIGRRGGLPFVQRDVHSVQHWPRTRHSQKPDASYDLIEANSPGPYLELFARRRRMGWDAWGNEVDSDVTMTEAGRQ